MTLAGIPKPKPFQFLVENAVNSKAKRTKENTVLLAFSRDQLRNKVVVWSDKSYCYYVFDKLADLVNYIDNYVDKSLYEVVFGEFPQKLKFDIDNCERGDIYTICDTIRAVWKEVGPPLLPPYSERDSCEFFIFKTSGMGYHIVIDFLVDNVEKAKAFYEAVIAKIDPKIAKNIDPKVYSSIQNFRLMGAQKNGGKQMSKISLSTPKATMVQSMIRRYD